MNVFKSRKFWAAVAALLLALFGQRAGIEEASLTQAIQVLVAYIVGTGLSDIRAGK
jgi:hypothetical protein